MPNDKLPASAALMRTAEPSGALGAGMLCGHVAHRGSATQEYGPLAGAVATLGLFFLAHEAVDQPGLFGQVVALLVLFGVILWGAIGVMYHAERVAHVLGEPLGTLVLTLSAITVELALIVSVMLNGGQNPTLARDIMFAVLMIIMNGLVGLALLLGGFRHRQQSYNLEGAQSFLVVLIPLSACALVLPDFTRSTDAPSLTFSQGLFFAALTLTLYGVFLALQTSRHRSFFAEAEEAFGNHQPRRRFTAKDWRALLRNGALLVATLVPVALLSHEMGQALETVAKEIEMPIELAGLIIACLILSPEGLAALRAAWANRLQRAVNILLGSALSTIGMTVPTVLLVGYLIGHEMVLGVPASYVTLLAVTLLVSTLTFGSRKTDMLKGAVHLVLFGVYLMLVIMP
jgi:Ca2+:H+ antiporter